MLIRLIHGENGWTYENDASVSFGAKATGLRTLATLGISTPPGLILDNSMSRYYMNHGYMPSNFSKDLKLWMRRLQETCECFFGDSYRPLFVSVRSSPCVSMPGILPTLLNVGMCEKYLLTDMVNLPGFVKNFEHWLRSFLKITQPKTYESISWPSSWSLSSIKAIMRNLSDCTWLNDMSQQIEIALRYIFQTFEIYTHRENSIISVDRDNPPGIIIQQMVWGNSDHKNSGTGVVFTRNPQTGDDELFGDYVMNDVGENLVSGHCKSMPLWSKDEKEPSMQQLLPNLFQELMKVCDLLQDHYSYVQDIEFTVDNGKLWILQSRNGRCTPRASTRITLDLLKSGDITLQDAVERITVADMEKAVQSAQASYDQGSILACGQVFSQGVVSGLLCFDSSDVEKCLSMKQNPILIASYPNAIDMDLLGKVAGLITIFGSSTSHLAVVARGLGLPFVANLNMQIDMTNRTCRMRLDHDADSRDTLLAASHMVTIDGDTGCVVDGDHVSMNYSMQNELDCFLRRLSNKSHIRVMANINIASEVDLALKLSAAGVGLCRTEHLIDTKDLVYLQAYVLSNNDQIRQDCLRKLLQSYENYFDRLLSSMADLPVIIRLLDAPLYEFLPKNRAQLKQVRSYCNVTESEISTKLESFSRDGGMLGLRGIRFGIVYPDFYEMQVRAIVKSWRKFSRAQVKILLPFVSFVSEVQVVLPMIESVFRESGIKNKKLPVGVMLETPSALMIADHLASLVQFFSFGTNDLSQLVFGICREDSSLIEQYQVAGILDHDIFLNIQHPSMIMLMRDATIRARRSNPNMEIGFCGEGELTEDCMKFLHEQRIDYLSCAVTKIPIMQFKVGKIDLTRDKNKDK